MSVLHPIALSSLAGHLLSISPLWSSSKMFKVRFIIFLRLDLTPGLSPSLSLLSYGFNSSASLPATKALASWRKFDVFCIFLLVCLICDDLKMSERPGGIELLIYSYTFCQNISSWFFGTLSWFLSAKICLHLLSKQIFSFNMWDF